MTPPVFTVEKCKYCGQGIMLTGGAFKREWVCPACGKTNKKKTISNLLA